MTITTDSRKRVILPGTAPGDVFACENKGDEIVLRRVIASRLFPRPGSSAQAHACGEGLAPPWDRIHRERA